MAEKTDNDHINTVTGESVNGNPGDNLSERRLPRSIRFSDSEWKLIEGVARERGMAASELVRHVSVGFATGKFSAMPSRDFSTSLPEISKQVDRIYNGVYLLATLKRDEMLDQERQEEMERIIDDARKSKDLIRKCAAR